MPPLLHQVRFCTSKDGTHIAYALCGEGPPLLWTSHWVHHIGHDWECPIWRPWLEFVMRRHAVVRYDWRGCGSSDRAVEFSAQRHLEDLEAVVEAAGLDRFTLLAQGNGAVTAVEFAARHPDRVGELVLIGCNTRGRLAGEPSPGLVAEVQARLELMERGWTDENPAYAQLFNALHIPDASVDQGLYFDELRRKTTSAKNGRALIEVFARADLGRALPKIASPALVLASRGDLIVPFEDARMAATLIPQARFVPLESRNHLILPGEPAWNVLTNALNEFLPGATDADSRLPLHELTPREREVLDLLAQGITNQSIATRLRISEKTVRNQVSIIFDKLEMSTRAEAVARARDAGLGRR